MNLSLKFKYYTVVFDDGSTWDGKLYKSKKRLINKLKENDYFNHHYEIEDIYIYNKNNKVVGKIVDLEME